VEHGPTRRLRGLYLEAPGVLRGGYALFSGERQVGALTSGGIAPTLDDQSIGLAYIDVPHDDTERLEVEIRGRRLPVRLTKAPFYKRAR
jgi:aminomethyltransferase